MSFPTIQSLIGSAIGHAGHPAAPPLGETVIMPYAYLRYLLDRILTSLWLFPTLGVLGACLAAFIMGLIDQSAYGAWLRDAFGFYRIGAEGARLILATIAGSMITIASLVFSMTLLTLTVASQQLGPRLIEWFMTDRVNQVVLGYFISLFVFTLLSIGAVDGGIEEYVPYATVLVAILATVVSLVLLVIYVHRAATSIQTDTVIASTGGALVTTLQDALEANEDSSLERPEPILIGGHVDVASVTSGYVQAVDYEALIGLAVEQDCVVEMRCRPGRFVLQGAALARIWHASNLDTCEPFREPFVLGPKRTATQDVEFALRGLVEIALRALSPGINDPFTAVACVDYLTAAVRQAMACPEPPRVLGDDLGVARVLVDRITLEELMATAYQPIGDAGHDNTLIQQRLLQALDSLINFASGHRDKQLVLDHLQRIGNTINRGIAEPLAKEALLRQLDSVMSKLG